MRCRALHLLLISIGLALVGCPPAIAIDDDDVADDDDDAADDDDVADDDDAAPCAGAGAVSCGASVQGDTTGGPTDLLEYACAAYPATGPEAYFRFDAPETATVSVVLTEQSSDLDLFVLGAGADGSCDPSGACLGASQGTGVELVAFDASGGEPYWIVVDGWGEDSGTFALDVSCLPASVFENSGQMLGSAATSGLALGDLDGDGDLDAFTANAATGGGAEPNRVWRNDGTGTFTDSGQELGSVQSAKVALGDVDGDGDLDAVVGQVAAGGPHTVWSNDGTGAFTNSGVTLGTGGVTAVQLADLDDDNDLDAVIGDPDGSSVWTNNGAGGFSQTQVLTDQDTFGVGIGDLDGDGDPDLYSANSGYDSVWLNDGAGGFTDTGQSIGTFHAARDVELGDFDGDGDLDALVVVTGDRDSLYLNNGAGSFSDSGVVLPDGGSWAVDSADLDGDGTLDAVIGRWGDPDVVLLNQGGGVLLEVQLLTSGDAGSLELGDLDGDGMPDAWVGQAGPDRVWINQL